MVRTRNVCVVQRLEVEWRRRVYQLVSPGPASSQSPARMQLSTHHLALLLLFSTATLVHARIVHLGANIQDQPHLELLKSLE